MTSGRDDNRCQQQRNPYHQRGSGFQKLPDPVPVTCSAGLSRHRGNSRAQIADRQQYDGVHPISRSNCGDSQRAEAVHKVLQY